MNRLFITVFIVFSSYILKGQILHENSIQNTFNFSFNQADTLKSFLVKKDPPYLFNANLHHKERTFGNKMVRGNNYVMAYNSFFITALLFAPPSISKWENLSEKLKFSSFMNQYKKSFTTPPVIDEDLLITNYLGHPYQGGYYYNTVRSQGATVLESSLFCLGQSLLWEYVWEAGIEQPSIQDLITTPVAGILVGELSHVATIAMSRHGFRWYEIAAVCVINPAYAFNNGFRFNKALKTH